VLDWQRPELMNVPAFPVCLAMTLFTIEKQFSLVGDRQPSGVQTDQFSKKITPVYVKTFLKFHLTVANKFYIIK